MDTVYAWMRNIIFYYIFLSAVMNFLPDNSYKKYIRFFMGVLLIVLLLTPVFQFFQMKGSLDDFLNKRTLEEAFQESKWNMVYAGDSQKNYLTGAYEDEVEKNINQFLIQKEVTPIEVDVTLDYQEEIMVKSINIILESVKEGQNIIKEIKNQLIEVYNISDTNINISTQG